MRLISRKIIFGCSADFELLVQIKSKSCITAPGKIVSESRYSSRLLFLIFELFALSCCFFRLNDIEYALKAIAWLKGCNHAYRYDDSGLVELKLSNGLRVCCKHTRFLDDEVIHTNHNILYIALMYAILTNISASCGTILIYTSIVLSGSLLIVLLIGLRVCKTTGLPGPDQGVCLRRPL